MQKQDYNILVTGSKGFIGTAICKFFRTKGILTNRIDLKKDFFENLDKKKINNFIQKKFKKNKINVLIHLGWGLVGEPFSKYHKINYEKSKLLFNSCLDLKFEKIIFCGSMNEYGNRVGGLREDHKPKNIKTLYSKYKYLTTMYGTQNINNFYSIRPSYVYGYNQRKGTLIETLVKSIKTKKKIDMSHCKLHRDYVFIDDVVNAFFKIAFSNAPPGIYNVGSGTIITLKKLILEIAKKSKFNLKYLRFSKLPKKKEQQHPKCFMVTKKIEKNCKWKINFDLDKGISRIIKLQKIN
jgi:nucleoside-diphosphate-sugar epimerase